MNNTIIINEDLRKRTRSFTQAPRRELMHQLKQTVNTLYDANGNKRSDEEVFSSMTGRNLKQVYQYAAPQYELLKEVLDYILSENYLSEPVRQWLFHTGSLRQAEFTEQLNIKLNTFKSQLTRARDKIISDFTVYMLTDLAGNNGGQLHHNYFLTEEELAFYRRTLSRKHNTVQKLQAQVAVNLEPYKDDYADRMDSDDFAQLLTELWDKTSLTSHQQLLQRCSEANLFGYVNYLLTNINRSEQDDKNYEQLMMFMRGERPTAYNTPFDCEDSDIFAIYAGVTNQDTDTLENEILDE